MRQDKIGAPAKSTEDAGAPKARQETRDKQKSRRKRKLIYAGIILAACLYMIFVAHMMTNVIPYMRG